MTMTVCASAASIGGATVNATALNLRTEASTYAQIQASAPSGAAVVAYETLPGWYKVSYRGSIGYMSAEFLNFSETLDGDFGKAAVRGTDVRLRSGAGYDAEIIGSYDAGTEMSVRGVFREWMKVAVDGVEGYMHSDYIELTATGAPGASSAGQAIVDTSYKYLNVPYVWAGTSPYGFDCSGLVYYVFTEHGYTVNRTAASLYQNGTAVDRANLISGDIICFTDGAYSTIGHVGIYVGDNKFIHASSGTGYVTVSSLSENYYNNHYYGSRRIAA